MIDIIQQYWRPFLWSDGYHLSGLAVTMWLLVLSIAFGFVVSIPLAVARVSKVKWLARSVWFYTYVFRGTPLYVQLLFFYTGMYSLDAVREVGFLNHFFREGYNCTILAFALNTCAYTTEIFAGAIKAPLRRDRSRPRLWHEQVHLVPEGDHSVGAAARAAGVQQ